MKFNKTLTIAALLAGSLLTAGSLLAQDAPKDKPPGTQGGTMRNRAATFDSIATQLKLTDEQKPKAKPAIEEMIQKMHDLRTDTTLTQTDRRAKMKEIRDNTTTKLKDILTAEQLANWEKMGPGNRRPSGNAGMPPKTDAPPKADAAK